MGRKGWAMAARVVEAAKWLVVEGLGHSGVEREGDGEKKGGKGTNPR